MKTLVLLAFALLSLSSTRAQQISHFEPTSWAPSANLNLLPSKVEPVAIREAQFPAHRFFDVGGKVAVGAVFSAATLDAVGTCRTLASGGYEYVLPTQRCAPATVMIFAGVAADISLAYMFHLTGHHKLERVVEIAGVANSASGIGLTQYLGGRW